MADRRLVAQSITDSGQVARLVNRCGPWAGLVFTWLLPFVDDDGRVDGDPDVVRSMVLGRFVTKVSEEEVAEYLAMLNDLDLAVWYEVVDSGERYLYLPGFFRQQGLRADRYVPSRRPSPPNWVPDESHPYAKHPDLRKSKGQRDGRRTRRIPKRKAQGEVIGATPAPEPRQPDASSAPDSRRMVAKPRADAASSVSHSSLSSLSDPSFVSLAAPPAAGEAAANAARDEDGCAAAIYHELVDGARHASDGRVIAGDGSTHASQNALVVWALEEARVRARAATTEPATAAS